MQPGVSVRPTRGLRPIDAIAIIVGVVVGVGIFRAPSMVAAGADTELGFIGLWALGGALSLVGALCYCELAEFPSAGGEYHFLHRAFGPNVSFLFAWARLTVSGTGSIALLAFVFGDYVATLVPLGPHGSAIARRSAGNRAADAAPGRATDRPAARAADRPADHASDHASDPAIERAKGVTP